MYKFSNLIFVSVNGDDIYILNTFSVKSLVCNKMYMCTVALARVKSKLPFTNETS